MVSSTSNPDLEKQLQYKIDTKTKPLGALGQLEKIAFQLGKIQQTLSPEIKKPTIIIFAGDHGIAEEGQVNPFPQEVTAQMVNNFLNGGAAINIFSKTNGIALRIVDAGVNFKFKEHTKLINNKIALGTKNFRDQPAMNHDECTLAMEKGAMLVKMLYDEGCNCIGFGEMGIGNTSSASLLMSYSTGISIAECVGAGTGLDSAGVMRKKEILTTVFNKYNPTNAIEALQCYGGFEIAMMCGAMIKAASLKMGLLIDGFIVNAALLIAIKLEKYILEYCIFSHCSNEQGHERILDYLGVEPILRLGLRLGEGTGAALAFPIVQSACNFLREMASFDSANVANKL